MKYRFLFLLIAWMVQGSILHAQSLEEDEKPLLTLACISDIHTERSLIDCANLEDIALRGSFVRTIAKLKKDEKIDVMLLGGDCTSDATIPVVNWQQVRKLIARYTRMAFPSSASTPVLYVTGNHDYEVANWDNIPKPYNAGDYYTFPMKDDIGELSENDAFYEEADNGDLGTMNLLAAYHYVINGFDFVILNCGKNFFKSAWDYVYSEESVQWVADKLAEIYADNPNKTVFFALHVPFSDSNSIREPSKGIASSPGEKLLKKTLSKYPNLIMLYGHDHGGDKAYTRRKTSQRVTRYDMNGNVIATTDETHVDGATQDPENDQEEEVQPTESQWYIRSEASGEYLGFNPRNLGMVTETNVVKVEVMDESKAAFALCVSGSGSEANGNYVISSSSGRFSANANKYPTYFFKVTKKDDTGIVAEKVSRLEKGETYVIVAENAKDRSLLYALTSEGYPATNSNRLVGLSVVPTDGKITLDASQINALWTLEEAVTETAQPSFFSAFMGSMRYYYNTIDPGDMPVETPNIVQALMVYVYADRVELHMKNYNRSGTINGITVNKELAPYISYRKVDVPASVQGVQLKDVHVERLEAYDLTGRKVHHPATKGVYVVNGKKMVVK
ncbi:MAG: metallophosphoesterase [Bacteroidaceae bacterium]|nr:metallophosphoesterase [Bacteroidaceae bacterium]MBQ6750469.1 metallophosphoesterase [Bacteroidaceae bacterium]